jgi:hypothetical protein
MEHNYHSKKATMEKEIDMKFLAPKENLDFKVSLRFNKTQKKKIENICRRYKIRKNDFFRIMLEDFLKRYKLPENGTTRN